MLVSASFLRIPPTRHSCVCDFTCGAAALATLVNYFYVNNFSEVALLEILRRRYTPGGPDFRPLEYDALRRSLIIFRPARPPEALLGYATYVGSTYELIALPFLDGTDRPSPHWVVATSSVPAIGA